MTSFTILSRAISFNVLFLLATQLCGQEERWAEAEGQASLESMTKIQARTTALNEARAEAIRLVAGVKLKVETFRHQSEVTLNQKSIALQDFFATLNREVAYGQIVNETVVLDTISRYVLEAGMSPQLYYRVKIRALVKLDKGEPDPAFEVRANTNRTSYDEHDRMTITVRPSKNCYLYVFNLLANDSLLVLFPNLYMQDNYLRADSTLRLLPEELGYLEVTLLPGMEQAQELIYVVATKQRFEFAPEWRNKKQGIFRMAASRSFATQELPRWLANIPLDRRADCVVGYIVHRVGKR